ncbi:hypothetical protein SEA_NITRO_37 [Arthrobacter phage Nitro]|uniref:Uncharacterized protein n=1 Tax=Arthrobacter phage Nitro TaxID=3077792 RepID=A0AA96HDK9_9CAUD|nr:hypothetical protein SEA_NITRO_37 [Arthrobacter phage Nitro]
MLLPVLGEPDARISLFADGSYTRWIPTMTRKILGSRPWELGASVLGGMALLEGLSASMGL